MTYQINATILFKLSLAIILLLSSSFTLQIPSPTNSVLSEVSSVVSPPRGKKVKKKTRKKHRKNIKNIDKLHYGVAILLGVLGILLCLFLGAAALSIFGMIAWNLWLGNLLGMIALGVAAILALVGAIFSFKHAAQIDKARREERFRQNPSSTNRSNALSILWGVLLLLLFLGGIFFGVAFIGLSGWGGIGFLILGVLILLIAVASLVFSIIFFAKAGRGE
jgi:hypothetical protein